MKATQGRVLAERISEHLASGVPTEESLYHRALCLLVESIGPLQDTASADLLELEQEVAAWYGREGPQSRTDFDHGAWWLFLEMYRHCVREVDRTVELDRCRRVMRKHFAIFDAIESMSGSTQGDIAEHLGYKRSNFSQILARLSEYQLHTANTVGKAKLLRLTRRGKELLVDTKRELQGDPVENIDASWQKQTTTNYNVGVFGQLWVDERQRVEGFTITDLWLKENETSGNANTTGAEGKQLLKFLRSGAQPGIPASSLPGISPMEIGVDRLEVTSAM